MEQWKAIKGYEKYEVSPEGQVRIIETGCIMSQRVRKDGYVLVSLHKDGKQKPMYLHRLVASAFIPNPENKRTVNHVDGVKQNNTVDNLEWNTQQENIAHMYEIGLRGRAKETGQKRKQRDKIATEIRELYASGEFTQKELSEMYNMAINTVYNIVTGISYKHLPMPDMSEAKQRRVLNPDKVREIRQLLDEGYAQSEVARKLGVSSNVIYFVVKGKAWSHVE